jgi:hypothetical protein
VAITCAVYVHEEINSLSGYHGGDYEKMPSSGMLRSLALVRTDVSEEGAASIFRAELCKTGSGFCLSVGHWQLHGAHAGDTLQRIVDKLLRSRVSEQKPHVVKGGVHWNVRATLVTE